MFRSWEVTGLYQSRLRAERLPFAVDHSSCGENKNRNDTTCNKRLTVGLESNKASSYCTNNGKSKPS